MICRTYISRLYFLLLPYLLFMAYFWFAQILLAEDFSGETNIQEQDLLQYVKIVAKIENLDIIYSPSFFYDKRGSPLKITIIIHKASVYPVKQILENALLASGFIVIKHEPGVWVIKPATVEQSGAEAEKLFQSVVAPQFRTQPRIGPRYLIQTEFISTKQEEQVRYFYTVDDRTNRLLISALIIMSRLEEGEVSRINKLFEGIILGKEELNFDQLEKIFGEGSSIVGNEKAEKMIMEKAIKVFPEFVKDGRLDLNEIQLLRQDVKVVLDSWKSQ